MLHCLLRYLLRNATLPSTLFATQCYTILYAMCYAMLNCPLRYLRYAMLHCPSSNALHVVKQIVKPYSTFERGNKLGHTEVS